MIEASVNDHRAIGLVERLIQTITYRLACIKEEESIDNSFHIKHALKLIIHQLRICKQKTTKILAFQSQFGRKLNTPLSIISIEPKLSNLSYENIVNHYLDEDTVTPGAILPDDKWRNEYSCDIEVEIRITRAAREANE